MLSVQIPLIGRCTRYNIMWKVCQWQVVRWWFSTGTAVASTKKHHNPNPSHRTCPSYQTFLYIEILMSMAYIGTILVLKMLSYIDRPFQVLIQLLTGQKGLKLQRSNHKSSMPEIQTMQWVRVRAMVLSATFNNISAISWWTMQWPKEKGYNLLSQTLYHLMLEWRKDFLKPYQTSVHVFIYR